MSSAQHRIGPKFRVCLAETAGAHIADAVKEGAKVVIGGKRNALHVTTDMVITKEETFGPVAPPCRFKPDAEAIKMANDTPTLPSPIKQEGEEGALPIFAAAATARLQTWPAWLFIARGSESGSRAGKHPGSQEPSVAARQGSPGGGRRGYR